MWVAQRSWGGILQRKIGPFVGTPPETERFWHTISQSSVMRFFSIFFVGKFMDQIFPFLVFLVLWKESGWDTDRFPRGRWYFCYIPTECWCTCRCPILALSSAIERTAQAPSFPLLRFWNGYRQLPQWARWSEKKSQKSQKIPEKKSKKLKKVEIFSPDLKNTFFGRFRAHDEFFVFLPMTPQSSNKWVAKRCNNLWRIDEFTFTETRIVCYSVLLKNVFEIYYFSSKFDREQFNGVSSTNFQHKLIVYRY